MHACVSDMLTGNCSYPRNQNLLQLQNSSRKLAHIVYIEKTEISMVAGVMLLVHKDISHMPITELENDSESIWVKVFANKTSHFVASWYRPPGSTSEEFQLFREQLDYIWTRHKGKKLPSVHVLGDFNFKNIDWPDRLLLCFLIVLAVCVYTLVQLLY